MQANMLLGAGAGGAQLPASLSVIDSRISPTNSTASITFSNAGTYSSVGNGSAPSGTWMLYGSGADYDIRFDVTGGALTTGSNGVWENLSVARSWSCTDTTVNGVSNQASGTLQIRRAATGQVVASCPLSISATKDV